MEAGTAVHEPVSEPILPEPRRRRPLAVLLGGFLVVGSAVLVTAGSFVPGFGALAVGGLLVALPGRAAGRRRRPVGPAASHALAAVALLARRATRGLTAGAAAGARTTGRLAVATRRTTGRIVVTTARASSAATRAAARRIGPAAAISALYLGRRADTAARRTASVTRRHVLPRAALLLVALRRETGRVAALVHREVVILLAAIDERRRQRRAPAAVRPVAPSQHARTAGRAPTAARGPAGEQERSRRPAA